MTGGCRVWGMRPAQWPPLRHAGASRPRGGGSARGKAPGGLTIGQGSCCACCRRPCSRQLGRTAARAVRDARRPAIARPRVSMTQTAQTNHGQVARGTGEVRCRDRFLRCGARIGAACRTWQVRLDPLCGSSPMDTPMVVDADGHDTCRMQVFEAAAIRNRRRIESGISLPANIVPAWGEVESPMRASRMRTPGRCPVTIIAPDALSTSTQCTARAGRNPCASRRTGRRGICKLRRRNGVVRACRHGTVVPNSLHPFACRVYETAKSVKPRCALN